MQDDLVIKTGTTKTGLMFAGETIVDVYQQIMSQFDSGEVKDVFDVYTKVEHPQMIVPTGCKAKEETIRETVDNLLLEDVDDEYIFNHFSKVKKYGMPPIDQWEMVAESLRGPFYTTRALFFIVNPITDFIPKHVTTPAPFFCMAQFKKDKYSRLGITGIYRRQELSQWWVANIWELMAYRNKMIEYIRYKHDIYLKEGPISTFAIAAYWLPTISSLVDVPSFDDHSGQALLDELIVNLFENRDRKLIDRFGRMLEEKIKTLGMSHAPKAGLKAMELILTVRETKLNDADSELYKKLWLNTQEALQLIKDITISNLDIAESRVSELRSIYHKIFKLITQ